MRWPRWLTPWRWDEPENGHEAAEAREEAERKLREAERRWPEVHHARNVFAAQVEHSLRRRHP